MDEMMIRRKAVQRCRNRFQGCEKRVVAHLMYFGLSESCALVDGVAGRAMNKLNPRYLVFCCFYAVGSMSAEILCCRYWFKYIAHMFPVLLVL